MRNNDIILAEIFFSYTGKCFLLLLKFAKNILAIFIQVKKMYMLKIHSDMDTIIHDFTLSER